MISYKIKKLLGDALETHSNSDQEEFSINIKNLSKKEKETLYNIIDKCQDQDEFDSEEEVDSEDIL